MATNLYDTLGLNANAPREQIQSAYEHWAKAFSPDNQGSEAEPFREVQDAYSVLRNPLRRQSYDQQIAATPLSQRPTRQSRSSSPRSGPVSPPCIEFSLRESLAEVHPSFDELFERLWSNFTLLSRPKAEHIESLTVEIPLTQDEASAGGRARILIPARAQCPACSGHGMVGLYECWHCQGHGAITADYPLDILYPAGILNQHVVRVPLNQFGIENFYLTIRFHLEEQLPD